MAMVALQPTEHTDTAPELEMKERMSVDLSHMFNASKKFELSDETTAYSFMDLESCLVYDEENSTSVW